MSNPRSLQGVVAEFVACVGPELGRKIILDMSRLIRI